MSRPRERGSTALPAACAALAVSAALSAAVSDIVRTELRIARSRLITAAALAAADACLARAVATMPPGWDFAATLAGGDGIAGTADDGVLDLDASCAARARPAPGAPDARRILLDVEGQARGGRRLLEAAVGRPIAPGVPAVLWLGDLPRRGAIAGSLVLDGRDPGEPTGPPVAGIAAPPDADALDGWVAGERGLARLGDTGLPLSLPPPPLAALGGRIRSGAPAGLEALTADPDATPTPGLALVAGDVVVPGTLRGAGVLFVDGHLEVDGRLEFAGLVVARGGLAVGGGAVAVVRGALWLGAADPDALLRVAGELGVVHDAAALRLADALVPLPRPARLLGLRDI
jgi:hypothetical protein